MIRNRRDTEDKLVRAVGAVLEISGFQKVGVNLLARTAGVDKVLIYRYFGGLDGLLSAFGESADIWWTVDEIVGDETAGPEQGKPIRLVRSGLGPSSGCPQATFCHPANPALGTEPIKRPDKKAK